MILDSSFIIDLFNKDTQAIEHARDFEEGESIKVSTISVFEVCFGISGEKKLTKADEFFDSTIILDVNRTIARRAATLGQELQKKGLLIDPEDCVIAATAILENEPIVTRNVKHFSRIPGLKIVTY
ncbi:MAG: PIN domain-containing protein [Nanoarchaeota archaeon]